MSGPPQFNLIVIRSSDIDRAVSFYRHLGLPFTRHSHGGGPEHYSSETAGIVFEIYPASAKSPSTSSTRIGFRVDAIGALVSLLAQIGAEIVTAPSDSEWGRRAVVKDFDGHTIELIESNE